MTKVTADITYIHGTLLPTEVVMTIEFMVEHWEESMLCLFADEQFQTAEDEGRFEHIVSIKLTFSDGQ